MSNIIMQEEEKIVRVYWYPFYGQMAVGKVRRGQKTIPAVILLCPPRTLDKVLYLADMMEEKGVLPKVYIKKEKSGKDIVDISVVFRLNPCGPLFLAEMLSKKDFRRIEKSEFTHGDFIMVTRGEFKATTENIKPLLPSVNKISPIRVIIAEKRTRKIRKGLKLLYVEKGAPPEIEALKE